jgi:hypothetical protein
MRKTKKEKLFKILGRIRRMRNHMKQGRDSNLISIEIVLIHINKIILLRMNPIRKDTNQMLGMYKTSHVQIFPSQRIQNENIAQHSRGYYNGRQGQKYFEDICIPRRSTSRASVPYD